jgi:hypothetical protein
MSNIVRYNVTGRGPSAALWDGYNLENLQHAQGGYLYFDDFLVDTTAYFTETQATAGTSAVNDVSGQQHGVWEIDSNSATKGQGMNCQLTGYSLFLPAVTCDLLFEARISLWDIGTLPQIFVGFHESDTTIITSDAMGNDDFAGWRLLGPSTDTGFYGTNQEGTGALTTTFTEVPVDSVTTVTWYKLGVRIRRNSKIEYFFNGKLVETKTTEIPNEDLLPSFVCQSGGTADAIMYVDWFAAAYVDWS